MRCEHCGHCEHELITGLYLIEHVNFVQLPHFQHALHFNHQHNQIVTLDILKIYMNDLHDVQCTCMKQWDGTPAVLDLF